MSALLLGLWLGAAHAGELALGLGASGTSPVHEPLIGPTLSVEWRPSALLGLGLAAQAPMFREGFEGVGRLEDQDGPPASVYLRPYRPTLHAEGLLRVNPIHQTYGEWWASAGVAMGFGVVRTVDDLAAFQAEFDPRAIATAVQWHPTTLLAVSAEARREEVGLRFTVGTLRWIETLSSTTLELTWPTVVQVELLWVR